jgi:dihydroorotase
MGFELIRGVRCLDPVNHQDQVADVLIQDGAIAAIGPDLAMPAGADGIEISGAGKVLGPGLVDLYSHSGEPGYESRETLASLSKSAIAGGITRLAVLPDTDPPVDNPAAVAGIRQFRLSGHPSPQLQVWGALTLGAQGEQMAELGELAAAGVVGFGDGQPIADLRLLLRLLEYAHPLGKPVMLWGCDRSLSAHTVTRDGVDAHRQGLPGAPAIAESIAVAAILEAVTMTGTPVHLQRISTARAVSQIAQAKAAGLPITASTPWLHLLKSTADLASYDPNLRLDPPLGTPEDQAALIGAVKAGVLDAIAVDHTPYSYEEKTVPFGVTPPGVIGLELMLPLLWHRFVESGDWPALTLWRALSTQPAQCLSQAPAQLQPHHPAELVLFDPATPWTVTAANLRSQSTNTAWLGQSIPGQVERVWC